MLIKHKRTAAATGVTVTPIPATVTIESPQKKPRPAPPTAGIVEYQPQHIFNLLFPTGAYANVYIPPPPAAASASPPAAAAAPPQPDVSALLALLPALQALVAKKH
jgi:hypothetical protein